ncbi:hypothetical protein ACEPAG_296 [Sanghuangporus baumii]
MFSRERDSLVMDADSKKLPEILSRERRPANRLSQLGRVLLVLCGAVQTTVLFTGLIRRFSHYHVVAPGSSRLAKDDPAGEWRDDVFPIREQTPWDISTDFPYPRTLAFDVDEGTWLRLDVHPVSGEIVFDMLGDLYCLPAAAYLQPDTRLSEQARSIIAGVPHDADPHFSPDGKILVFRSDAELGVDNIWATEWKGCELMNLRSNANDESVKDFDLSDALLYKDPDESLLASGIKETPERKWRRLLREGRSIAQRVTNETYRFVSDARFHPSGSKLIATKWYTSSRSLGAGEGWIYELPKWGLEVAKGDGERAVGRTLPAGWGSEEYGSQRIGPEQFIWSGEDAVIYAKNVIDVDGTYQYSKDPHSGIYSIFRTNLTTKRTETLVSSSPGGASRPELSRDGRTLAFVRRVRDKEALVLKDLKSGAIRNIWYGLSYDLTIISAPMGTYPSFAFTPNDNAIIIWAAGKLWHVPLSVDASGEKVLGGEPQTIPFKAHIEKRLAPTRTSKTDLLALEEADTQRLHALIDLAVADDGSRIAFQGAGISYYSDFDPSTSMKTPKPIKIPVLRASVPYYSPSFIPGNKDLVIHARWSDRNLTTFELADISSEAAYELSGLPLGRYIHPVVCRCPGNSRKIAFIKASGDYLSGSIIATAEPGLYIGDITLPDSLVEAGLSIPISNVQHLQTDISVGDRTTMKFLNGSKQLLVHQSDRAFIIDLASGPNAFGDYNHTIIAEGRFTSEVAVPIKHDKVAFVDNFNVFVTDIGNVGGSPLWSKPGNATKGIARVSLDGGHDVQWDAAGKRLFWLLGPYLHSVDISRLSECSSKVKSDAMRFGIDCIKNLLDIRELEATYSTDIARLKHDAKAVARSRGADARDAEVYAISNATILSMNHGTLEDDLLDSANIIIRGGIIEAVGPSSEVEIPHGATILEAQGAFIVPGFIDVHAHWNGFGSSFPSKSWELQTFLAYGVTTLHNPSSDNVLGFVERARVESGQMAGPRIFHTGDVIYGAGAGGIHNTVADLTDARSALIRIKVEGGPASFSYKNYNQPSRAARQRLLLEARNLSMLCFPEGGMNQDWNIAYIVDGMTTVEHALPIPELYDDVLSLYALSGTGATPTHIVNYGGVMGEQYLWAHEEVANDPKLRRFTRHDILESVIETTSRPIDSFQLFNTSASIAKMVKKGLKTHIGAHGEAPLGRMYHAEMFFTASGGLTPYETLRAATRDAAITLGLYDSLGSLTPGKLADLLVYKPGAKLLEDIEETQEIRYVTRGGRVWDAETMVEEWPLKGKKSLMPIINAD